MINEQYYVKVCDLMLQRPRKKLFVLDEHVPLTSLEIELWSEVIIIGDDD